MRPYFRPQLVNGPFGDPALYVDLLFGRRALLFDIGDIEALEPRRALRVSDVFVSHRHMDHFIGLGRLVRLRLGRDRPLRLWGPEGLIDGVEHVLAAFTWNLVGRYPGDFAVEARELGPAGRTRRALFRCRERFERRDAEAGQAAGDVLFAEPEFRVRAAILDHGIPCLGFALEESAHVNVWKNRLDELGVEPGPWLRDLKRAVLAGAADDTELVAHGRRVRLGGLRGAFELVLGEKIGYVTDVAAHADNVRRIVALVRGADRLFIETPFLEADRAQAERRDHLTAHAAGAIARAAGVGALVPFHFSPRYADQGPQLEAEAQLAFGAVAASVAGAEAGRAPSSLGTLSVAPRAAGRQASGGSLP